MRKKILQKKFIYPFLILLLLLTAFALPALTRTEVNTAEVKLGTVRKYVFEDETKTRLDMVRNVSAPIAGTIRRIELEVGDEVEPDQIITTIEDEEILHAIAGAEAKVREIEAYIKGLPTKVPRKPELEAAAKSVKAAVENQRSAEASKRKAAEELEYQSRQYRRKSSLHEKDAIPDDQYELARLSLTSARESLKMHSGYAKVAEIEARITAMELEAMEESLGDIDHLKKAHEAEIERISSELETLRYRAGKTLIKSPISGVITEKHLDSEAAVQAGEPLLKIGNLDSIEIKSDILSADRSMVQPGQEVMIEGQILGDRQLTGTVRRIYPHGFTRISALGIEQQRFRTIIDFDNTEANLPPGADLDVRIIIEQKEDTLYIPSAALFMTIEGPAVFIVEGRRARLRHVETGLSGDERIEVISGLKEHDMIILRPPPQLSPGDRVRHE